MDSGLYSGQFPELLRPVPTKTVWNSAQFVDGGAGASRPSSFMKTLYTSTEFAHVIDDPYVVVAVTFMLGWVVGIITVIVYALAKGGKSD